MQSHHAATHTASLRRERHSAIPLPPAELRELVGPTDPAAFDNPTGELIYPGLGPGLYEAVFDFGCGCGRVARQLLQQRVRPREYLGIDLHRGMVEWCRENLTPVDPAFRFEHHDVHNPIFNPGGSAPAATFPAPDRFYSLVIAHSVFTHVVEWQAMHYVRETARVLAPHGIAITTWFLFDKVDFPMLGEANHALYARYDDPTAAVAYDADWVKQTAEEAGLKPVATVPPASRGHQWQIQLAHQDSEHPKVPLTSVAPGASPPAGTFARRVPRQRRRTRA